MGRGLFPLPDGVVDLLARCTFPPRGAPIDCAVSGGPDSLALLVLAAAAGCEVTAWHVDHGLRPGGDKEAAIVSDAASRLGADSRSVTLHLDAGPNLEARARAARLAALPAGVATGHTADDQAETILLNLLRGSGLNGLAGMRPGFRHPILRLRRSETTALVRALDLDPVHDPTNDSPVHRRNRVRHELLPLAAEIAGRDLVPVLTREAELLAAEADMLDSLAAALDPTDASAIAAAPIGLARRAVRQWVRANGPGHGHPPSAASVERILTVARGETRSCQIEGGHKIVRSKGRLRLELAELAVQGGDATK
ncbi:MAG TPA: tRNA lysidine(34) synthetase TilS [Acidimicrobiales bacterium]|nr:tRNA lysidine(34) synthetase TilS [Acidimicrobiales bacterium]